MEVAHLFELAHHVHIEYARLIIVIGLFEIVEMLLAKGIAVLVYVLLCHIGILDMLYLMHRDLQILIQPIEVLFHQIHKCTQTLQHLF